MNPNDGLKNVALKAGFTYVLSNVMVKAITVITTPIFARIMTTEEYGTFQTFVSWYNLLLPFLTLNLTYSIGRAKIDFPDRLDKYLGAMLALSSIFSGAVFLLTVLLIRPVTAMLELTTFQTTGLMVYLFFANPILLYQNLCRYRYEYKQNIAIAWYTMLSTTILSLAFIYIFKSSNKADMRILGTVIPTVVLSIYLICKLLASNLLNTDIKFWKYGLQISLPLILHTVSMHILSQSDRIFITKIWGKTDTAFYSLAYTYGVLLGVFTSAVGEGWLPWFHDTYHVKRFDEINKNSKPLVLLGCYIGLACIALAPEAIYILGGRQYEQSVYCVAPVALGVVCQYIYTHYVNIELHLKLTTFVSGGTVFAAIFNIVTNAIFIPKFGYIAAGYTTLTSYILLMLIHFIITRKILHVKLYNDLYMFASLFITILVAAVIVVTYKYTLLRYLLILIGFVSCVISFRTYIGKWIRIRRRNCG